MMVKNIALFIFGIFVLTVPCSSKGMASYTDNHNNAMVSVREEGSKSLGNLTAKKQPLYYLSEAGHLFFIQ